MIDLVRHGLRLKPSAAHERYGHTVEETGGEISPSEGGVVQHVRDDVGLSHEKNGQRGIHNALAFPADAVYADWVTGIALQHYVDIDVLRIDTREGIEYAALA